MNQEFSLIDNTIVRPNSNSINQVIPNDSFIWKDFYLSLSQLNLNQPISNFNTKIDPFFGYFGFRYHPIKKIKNYFHTGIDIVDNFDLSIFPIADGLLQYSGYHSINGNYVMMSHPQIKLPQGYSLFSLYLHLNSYSRQFSLLSKIFRELGYRNKTDIPIKQSESIGTLGDSGISKGIFTHLHLQIELRSLEKKQIILLDPLKCFGFETKVNLSQKANDLISLQKMISESEFKTNYRL